MKRILLPVIITFLTLCLTGQNYTPFPTEFSTWSVYHEQVTIPPSVMASMRYYTIEGDTVIDGLDYQKVFKQGLKQDETLTNPVYVGALREDSLKNIWYRNHSEPFLDTTDIILYRFDIEPDDTIFYSFETNGFGYIEAYAVVYDTGQMTIGGEVRKTYEVAGDFFGGDKWVEGLGGLNGLFSLYSPHFEQQWQLSCFHTNYIQLYEYLSTNLFYTMGGLNPCYTSLIVGMTEEIEDVSEIQVGLSPNPFTSLTILSYTLDKPSTVTISIFNPQGQLIEKIEQKQQKGEQHVQWNAEGLPAGIYYFRLQAGEKVGGGKIIKISDI
jgi:hypothetical protein